MVIKVLTLRNKLRFKKRNKGKGDKIKDGEVVRNWKEGQTGCNKQKGKNTIEESETEIKQDTTESEINTKKKECRFQTQRMIIAASSRYFAFT